MGFFSSFKPGRRTSKNIMRKTLSPRSYPGQGRKILKSGFFKKAMDGGTIKGRHERRDLMRGMRKNMGISRARSRRLARRLDKNF